MWTGFVQRGIKPENIIFMGYKNNINYAKNPFPGMIFVGPSDTTDSDWAQYGCFDHLDYTGQDVNKEVFLGILSGDAERVTKKTGIEKPKVLNAGVEDTVFVYYIDHGNDNIIAVGKDKVTSEELLEALETAHKKQIFGKFVWFMEACHSGSMFVNLPSDWNIFVMTASDEHHNAKMADCPPGDIIAGKHMGTCIGSLWDDSYLDYLDEHPDCTIGEIVDAVHDDVAKKSEQNVSHYGDMSFRDLKLAEFVGYPQKTVRSHKKVAQNVVSLSDVPAHLAKWRAIRGEESAEEEYKKIIFAEAKKEIEVIRLGVQLLGEKAADNAMKTTASNYSIDCVRNLSLSLVEKCGHSIPLPSSASNMLRNICTGNSTPNVDFNEICI